MAAPCVISTDDCRMAVPLTMIGVVNTATNNQQGKEWKSKLGLEILIDGMSQCVPLHNAFGSGGSSRQLQMIEQ